MIPISVDKYEIIKTSNDERVSFMKKIEGDDEVIKALKSVPNAEAYAEQESLSLEKILDIMSCQDVIQCLTNLFGVPKIGDKGTCGILCALNSLTNTDISYALYQVICTGLQPDVTEQMQELLSTISSNWGLNATTDQFKVAILLSNVNDNLLNEYWHLMYNVAYANIYGEDGHSSEQLSYLNGLISNAKEHLENFDIDYMRPSYVPEEIEFASESNTNSLFLNGVKTIAESGGHYKDGLIDYRLSPDGKIEAYANKDEVAHAIVKRMRNSDNPTTAFVARSHDLQPSQLALRWFLTNEANAVRPGDIAIGIRGYIDNGNNDINTFIHTYTIKSSFWGYISCPEQSIESSIKHHDKIVIGNDTRLFVLSPKYEGFLSSFWGDRGSVGSDEYRVSFQSNAYSDTFFYDINVMDKQPKKPISLHWFVKTGDIVKEDEIICKISTPFAAYSVKSKANGYIGIDKADAVPESDDGYEYGISDFDGFYTLYNTKNSLYKCRYYNSVDLVEEDLDKSKYIKWDPMAGRHIDDMHLDAYEYFEVTSSESKKIFVSFQLKDERPVMVLGAKAKDHILSKDDEVSLLLEDKRSGESETIRFALTKGYNGFDKVIFNSAFCSPIYKEDLDKLSTLDFTQWRVESKDGACTAFGENASDWTPRNVSGRAFRDVVKAFIECLNSNDINIPTRPVQKHAFNQVNGNDECWLLLLHNKRKRYYKLTICNSPIEDDETIEVVCAKTYPSSIIANAIVSAFQTAFSKKRVNEDWLNLSESEVTAIKDTLS